MTVLLQLRALIVTNSTAQLNRLKNPLVLYAKCNPLILESTVSRHSSSR